MTVLLEVFAGPDEAADGIGASGPAQMDKGRVLLDKAAITKGRCDLTIVEGILVHIMRTEVDAMSLRVKYAPQRTKLKKIAGWENLINDRLKEAFKKSMLGKA